MHERILNRLPAATSPLPRWRSPSTVVVGLTLLLLGNAFLPFFSVGHPLVQALEYACIFTLTSWVAGLAWVRARDPGPGAYRFVSLSVVLSGLHYAPTLFRLPFAGILGPLVSIFSLLALGAGFLLWPQQVRMRRDRVRTSLDSLAMALSLFTVAWVFVDYLQQVGAISQRMFLLYMGHVSVCLGVIALWGLQEFRLVGVKYSRDRSLMRGALLVTLCHGFLVVWLRTKGLYRDGFLGHGAEVLCQVANVLLALSALSPSLEETPEAPEAGPAPWRAFIPSAVSLLVLLLATAQGFRPHTQTPYFLLGLGAALLGALVVRHGLLIIDLEHLSHDLEGRVEERTRKLEQLHNEALIDMRVRLVASLAAGLAHDLNNMLTAIRLRLECLRTAGADDLPGHLDLIEAASERAAAITRRILASSRLPEMVLAELDLAGWFSAKADLMRSLLLSGQTLVVEIEQDLKVVADAHALEQVFENLITNARDAMPATGTVRITARTGSGAAILAITDDGPGIAPAHWDRLFEPLFTTKGSGTGLGLATVRTLILQNHGAIHAENTEGAGATFVIELPVPDEAPAPA